ncbi:MAG: phosphoribosyltransferase regulatory subunit [Solirubrobacteraceae bacterium]|jgi:ATP phosphoribosyltransferase regulatory subunit HisZ|nr:phosphoribosyltransferase regulatory subunit [Solirubrobacteraceae bacterium]
MHPIPSGTRDVLPDEMRELRAITAAIAAVFDDAGYGEVYTPALEHEETLRTGDDAAGRAAYRVFDASGQVMVLRSDMTIPLARVVATRYGDVEPPLRLCYLQRAYRAVRSHRGESREQLQAGLELHGAPGTPGTVEALEILCRALDATGLKRYKLAIGSAGVYPALLDEAGVSGEVRARLNKELVTRDFAGLEREVLAAGADPRLFTVPQLRGGVEVLDAIGAAGEGLRALYAALPANVQERVIFDLGLLRRELGYYTGAIFEVLDASVGVPLGGGGRYDELLGRFGRPLPAVGWMVEVERVHEALVKERS